MIIIKYRLFPGQKFITHKFNREFQSSWATDFINLLIEKNIEFKVSYE